MLDWLTTTLDHETILSHSMDNWEYVDFTLDDIKFITNFLRYNNNYGYVDKCPHS